MVQDGNSNVVKGIGGFGSLFRFSSREYRSPLLVSSADGVGTKLKIAELAGKHDTVGIDAVAMNVNDILCLGARPLFFLDYIAYSQVPETTLLDIVKGIRAGCSLSGCPLIGGETAQMPGMYKPGEYDLAGFCVGVADEPALIDGSRIEAGNVIIGLESSGIHSNGYSLVRKVLPRRELARLSRRLLVPTRIYVKPVLGLLESLGRASTAVRGISHITGGSFYDKIARILPKTVNARIYTKSWAVPELFRIIQAHGVEEDEMYHTLNMGIGMALIVEERRAERIQSILASYKQKTHRIGEISRGNRQVVID